MKLQKKFFKKDVTISRHVSFIIEFFFSLAFFLFFEDVKRVKIFDMSPFTQQTQKGDERKNLISFIERLIKITAL